MSDLPVNIKGTFSKNERPHNGLDDIAEYLDQNRMARVPVIGYVEYHGSHDIRGRGRSITVSFGAVEPLVSPEGKDTDGAAEQGWQMLDQRRKMRGMGTVQDTLFGPSESKPDGEAKDPTAGPWPGDADYKGDAEPGA